MSNPRWECATCGSTFPDVHRAVEHKLRYGAASIWPVYDGFYSYHSGKEVGPRD